MKTQNVVVVPRIWKVEGRGRDGNRCGEEELSRGLPVIMVICSPLTLEAKKKSPIKANICESFYFLSLIRTSIVPSGLSRSKPESYGLSLNLLHQLLPVLVPLNRIAPLYTPVLSAMYKIRIDFSTKPAIQYVYLRMLTAELGRLFRTC